ncbi:hypothetical protein IT409_01525 [Candidatus Falkowbacteria bacterium]|nr:hypothetical protein [Candidatus Falkowbacteria bacterium]
MHIHTHPTTWYIDLDSTLYDTPKFKEALAQSMSGLIHPDDFLISFEQVLRSYEQGYAYSIERHANVLQDLHGIPADITTSTLSQIVEESNDFVYDDVIPFLESKRDENLILLSFGDTDFQMAKINASGLTKYFKHILVTEAHKHTIALPTAINSQTIFLNDNRLENKQLRLAYPQAKIIEIQRDRKDIPDEDFEVITSLREIGI